MRLDIWNAPATSAVRPARPWIGSSHLTGAICFQCGSAGLNQKRSSVHATNRTARPMKAKNDHLRRSAPLAGARALVAMNAAPPLGGGLGRIRRAGSSWKSGCRDRNLALLDCRATLAMTEGGMRRKPTSVAGLTELGRVRLSKSFFMRDMLHSEIAQVHGLLNAPDDPELAIEVGTRLATDLLEPLQERWGVMRIRSAYRSVE